MKFSHDSISWTWKEDTDFYEKKIKNKHSSKVFAHKTIMQHHQDACLGWDRQAELLAA